MKTVTEENRSESYSSEGLARADVSDTGIENFLGNLASEAREHIQNSRAENTRRAYR